MAKEGVPEHLSLPAEHKHGETRSTYMDDCFGLTDLFLVERAPWCPLFSVTATRRIVGLGGDGRPSE